jgi:DNA-binding response OmpR family regulator
MILDVMMPRLSGFEVLRELGEAGELLPECPVLILTARTAEKDITKGFDLGASDYLTKPFMVGELRARVRALLRRPR